MKLTRAFSFLLFIFCFSSCVTLPKSFQTKDEVIFVGPGPEDMVVDTITEEPRLLVSCNSRRPGEKNYAEIFVYYPETGKNKLLKRINEPSNLLFNPHGIDLVKVNDDLILLVVNHESEIHLSSILRYKVLKDELIFLNKITDPLIASPNAVAGFSNGTFLVSNDAGKAGNFIEAFLMLKRAQIVFYDGLKCSVAAGKFCYTNGITIKDNRKVYLTSTRQNKVWQFDFAAGKLINQEVIAKVHGGDNLRLDGKDVLVACHLRFLDFLKHMKNSQHHSPSTVYRIKPDTRKTTVEFYDDGNQISAASTGIVFRHSLYVSGVFDPKMVRKKIK